MGIVCGSKLFFKRIEYWLGSGLELFSAWFIEAVYHDSSVLRILEEPLSITWEFLKSIERFEDQNVFSDVGTSCVRLHIPYAVFLSSFKASASLAYIAPWAVGTRYFVNHIWLKFNRRSGLRRRKLLLQWLEWPTDNSSCHWCSTIQQLPPKCHLQHFKEEIFYSVY